MTVICADADAEKVRRLQQNEVPIYEPGLEPMIRRNQAEGRLAFTTDRGRGGRGLPRGLHRGRHAAGRRRVGRPAARAGRGHRPSAGHMNDTKVVITKSTVPVGTAEKVRAAIRAETELPFMICSNPEFLKEGAAIDDFMKPDRVVVGVDNDEARQVVDELYSPFVRTGNPILFMDIPSAEVTKYAANAMLATRISFMNQIAALLRAGRRGRPQVRQGIGSDRRIGPAFLFPGPGYGGSCFPKDVKALIRSADEHGLRFDLLEAVEAVNAGRSWCSWTRRVRALGGDARGQHGGRVGPRLQGRNRRHAGEPGHPADRRGSSAPGRPGPGARSQGAWRRPAPSSVTASCTPLIPMSAVQDADALVIVTEWLVYRNPDFARLLGRMRASRWCWTAATSTTRSVCTAWVSSITASDGRQP